MAPASRTEFPPGIAEQLISPSFCRGSRLLALAGRFERCAVLSVEPPVQEFAHYLRWNYSPALTLRLEAVTVAPAYADLQ
jgi:hypothetical protein